MINILLDKLPTKTPNGFKIRTDFRNCIEFELLMQDRNLKDEDKIILALNIFYKDLDEIVDFEAAINDILWFYSMGKLDKVETEKQDDNKKIKQIYSYEFDANLIFSAFMEQYKIDLNVEKMHWWKFKSLFEGLSEKTKIVEIMGYRAVDIGKIKDKDEKAKYKKLQLTYALPDMRTVEEKEKSFGSAFW